MALDFDVAMDDEPEWVGKLAGYAVNLTARGRHLIFRQPAGMAVSNSTSRFPTQGWGEVRGVGGYIVIFAADRPGFMWDRYEAEP
jgi:hypothetical protein